VIGTRPPLEAPSLAEIEAARRRLAGLVTRTPLLRLPVEAPAEIWLKLENLQPIGSFKLRGAGNAMRAAAPESLAHGVVTASAGNMAQGVAWCAREMRVPCTVVVPEGAPQTKRAAIERLGGKVVPVPFTSWWQALQDHGYEGVPGRFLHPVADPLVIAGNATIGLEILEDLPQVDAVVIPFGGGGLSSGIASALKAAGSRARIYAAEIETAAPLSASLVAGEPRAVERQASFVDGIGGRSVLPEMWPLVSRVLDGSLVVGLEQAAAAIRLLVERARVVAEGAGAVPVAAALAGAAGSGRVVCVVSGGNLDAAVLARILAGETPLG
jgi:threonine dehydratase